MFHIPIDNDGRGEIFFKWGGEGIFSRHPSYLNQERGGKSNKR
jgi:hypothetical protein